MSRLTSRQAETPEAPIATLAAPASRRARGARGESGARGGTGRRLTATIARWPLELETGMESERNPDPAIAIVRRCLGDYRSGRADTASRSWHDDITWNV